MQIFRADLSNLDELAILFDQYRQFYDKPSDLNGCRQFMGARLENDESVVFSARVGSEQTVGFTQLYCSFCSVEMGELIYLYDLFVAPEFRRQGVARALMDAARQYGIDRAADRLQLETAVDNTAAQSLYERLGWERDEVFYTYHLQFGA